MKKQVKTREFLHKIDKNTGEERAVEVPAGTVRVYQARIASLKKGVTFGGFEELYDLKKKIYSPRALTDTNLISFRPPHTQELKISLANAHESDPYMKRITAFYTNYTFGDAIMRRVVPLQTDKPKSRDENDDLVQKIITKKEHEGFMRFMDQVDYMSDIYYHMKTAWHQSYPFGMAALWKTLSLKELVKFSKNKQIVNIPLHTPIKIKPIDGFYLTHIHQDVDTMDPVFFEYINPNSQLSDVLDVNDAAVPELSFRANTRTKEQYNMLPWERLIIIKRPNIGTTPNTNVYGYSPILPALYISENIRRIDEKILPELNEGSYAGVGLFSVPEDSKYDLDKLATDLSTAGTRIILNEAITYTPIEVDFNMDAIINQKIALIKSELMALGVPETFFFPMNTNRSILEIIINIWQNIDLQNEREELNRIMWNYWYKDLMKSYFPDEDLLDLSINVKLEFKNKTFAGFIDKAAPTIEAYKVGLLNKQEGRENIDQDELDDSDEEPFAIKLQKIQKATNSGFPSSSSSPTSNPSRSKGVSNSGDKISSATKVSNNTSRSRTPKS